MQIILAKDIEHLGRAGEIVKVAAGYARNYLLPEKLALPANPKNMKWVEHQKKAILEQAQQARDTAEAFAERLSAVKLTFAMKAGEEGKLFGSVTAQDIADAIGAQGLDVDRKRIVIDEPIKRLGDHTVSVKVHTDVTASIPVLVTGEGGEKAEVTEAAAAADAGEAGTGESGEA